MTDELREPPDSLFVSQTEVFETAAFTVVGSRYMQELWISALTTTPTLTVTFWTGW